MLCTPTVVMYNKYMGVVDLNDKMCRVDKTRRTYKWYIRIDCTCAAWALFNAFVIEAKVRPHGRTRDFRQFMVEVIHQLIGENSFCSKKQRGPSTSATLSTCITDACDMPVKGVGKLCRKSSQEGEDMFHVLWLLELPLHKG